MPKRAQCNLFTTASPPLARIHTSVGHGPHNHHTRSSLMLTHTKRQLFGVITDKDSFREGRTARRQCRPARTPGPHSPR